jgi:hypothetical protein
MCPKPGCCAPGWTRGLGSATSSMPMHARGFNERPRALFLRTARSEPDGRNSPTITVDQPVALFDTPLAIGLEDLVPGTLATITATWEMWGRVWQSEATFRASNAGRIEVMRDAPVSGTYTGASAMELFWSAAPMAGTHRAASRCVTRSLTGLGPTARSHRACRVRDVARLLRGRDADRGRGARKEALVCVRDGGIWSPLAPPGSR